jgi:hypothetical protein
MKGDQMSENGNPYVSSIVSKYGDLERANQDARVLREIYDRQGASLLIDVIAGKAGECALEFKIGAPEIKSLRESLVNELNEAILERT